MSNPMFEKMKNITTINLSNQALRLAKPLIQKRQLSKWIEKKILEGNARATSAAEFLMKKFNN